MPLHEREGRLGQGDDHLDERPAGLWRRSGAGGRGEGEDGREQCKEEDDWTPQARMVRAIWRFGPARGG